MTLSASNYHDEQILDWRGMQCPAPIINTAKAVRRLKGSPANICILADDPAFPLDIQSWCRSAKAKLLSIDEGAQGFTAHIAVNQDAAPQEAAVPAPSPGRQRGPAPSKTTQRIGSFAALAAVPSPGVAPVDTLDCVGQQCPAPIINTAKRARKLEAGQSLSILADDPAFPVDIQSWCRSAKVELVDLKEEHGRFHAIVRKAGVLEASAPQPIAAPPQPVARAASSGARTEITIDLIGLGPVQAKQRLSSLNSLAMEDAVAQISADDAQFPQHLVAWCGEGQHTLLSLDTNRSPMVAVVALNPRAGQLGGGAQAERDHLPVLASGLKPDHATILVMQNDLERLIASLIIATTAASNGKKVTMFFTFWGINMLRGDMPRANEPVEKVSWIQRMFKWMMPRGPHKQKLSKYHFGGAGSGMLKGIMKDQNVMSLNELIDAAIDLDVEFIVCTMTMGVMGLSKRDIADLPNITFGGAATYIDRAQGAGLSLAF